MKEIRLNGVGEPKKHAKTYKGGGVLQERMYSYELLKIGAFTMFLNFPFCFLISLFLISLSGQFSTLPDHETRFSSPHHWKN